VVAVSAARCGLDRTGSATADHPTGPDIRGVRQSSAHRARSGAGSVVRHLPFIRRFLHEVCPAGAGDLSKVSQEDVTGYIERHARDWSAASGKAMCWSLRAFLRPMQQRIRRN
jgi:hypothetical protein